MLDHESYQLRGQRKCSPLGILNVPLPSIHTVRFRGDVNRHPGKINIAPCGVQKFPTTHAGTQTHTNKQLPFDRRTFFLVLPGNLAQAAAFLI